MAFIRDLTSTAQNQAVLRTASQLLAEHGPEIVAYDRHLVDDVAAGGDVLLLQAARCAHARYALGAAVASHRSRSAESAQHAGPLQVSVVWAMYRETVRIGPPSVGGQDFLRHKIEQMRWLTDGLDVVWHLYAVDDGCPTSPSSAQVARQRLASDALPKRKVGEQVTVLELQDGLAPPAGGGRSAGLSPAFQALRSTDESRKGGSIVHGLWQALHEEAGGQRLDDGDHILLYTDADLSANLAEAGLLLAPIVRGEAEAVAGHRYGVPGAVLIDHRGARCEPASTGDKPDKMIVLFRHFVRGQLFPELRSVADTQAGFKAFSAGLLRRVLPQVEAFDETFDVELLIRCGPLAVAPITFVEDFDNSNFRTELAGDDDGAVAEPGERHFAMITQLLEIHARLAAAESLTGGQQDESDLLSWLRRLDLATYQRVVRKLQVADAQSRAKGHPDPLFGVDWTLSELSELSGG